MNCPNCNAPNIDRMHTCDPEPPPFRDELQIRLAVGYSRLLINNSSLIVERKPGSRGFLELIKQ